MGGKAMVTSDAYFSHRYVGVCKLQDRDDLPLHNRQASARPGTMARLCGAASDLAAQIQAVNNSQADRESHYRSSEVEITC